MERKLKVRDSNFELLRLLAIFMIIVHHLVIKSAQTCGYTRPYDSDVDGCIGLIINGLVVGGVNLFILISGWYGVKRIVPQIIRLIIDCFVYSLITNVFCVLVLGYPFSWSELFFSCFFTHNWFVAAFIMFLLLIPLVERSLRDIDNKTLTYFVILLTIFNVVFGFGYGAVNSNGYNAANFAYIYIVARWLKSYSDTSVYKRFASNGLLLWLICCVPLVVGFIILTNYIPWQENLSQKYFGYNNPLSNRLVYVFFTNQTSKSLDK